MSRLRARAATAAAVLGTAAAGALLLGAAPALAADATGTASIAHAETTDGTIRVLVSVPPATTVDLSGVTAALDGTPLDAAASEAGDTGIVQRTAVLAIDTSNSMRRGGRFAAAQEAAVSYLETVPQDVEVGVVTFDSDVEVALEPTTDRAAAELVVQGLTLSRDTLLYDGVSTAVATAGSSGQRSVLLLSDGADTGSAASLDDTTTAIADADVLLDVVSLGQRGDALAALETLAVAGDGDVIASTGRALGATFEREADVLASQVLVTAELPDGFDAPQATIEVVLPTASGELVARALTTIQQVDSAVAPTSLPSTAAPSSGVDVPGWLLYAGVGVLAVGLVGAAVLLVPAKPQPMSVAERVAAYTGGGAGGAGPATAPGGGRTDDRHDPVLDQAKAAAANVLRHNRGLDERLSRRLAAAGSEFKTSEWLLLHVGVVVGATLLGLLVGRGSVVVGLVFLLLGLAAPPLVLRWKASRRRRAFETHLPEVLQILSGALSAGLSLAQAVDTVVREGPEPVASEFKRVLVENRIGMSLEDAFEGVADRYASKDFAWVVMAIRIQRQVGGNLAELLTTVAGTMRERAYLRRQVRTLSAEGRLSAVILCGLPPAFALFLLVINPAFLEPLVADLRGLILLGFGVTWLLIGVLWMSRLVKVEV